MGSWGKTRRQHGRGSGSGLFITGVRVHHPSSWRGISAFAVLPLQECPQKRTGVTSWDNSRAFCHALARKPASLAAGAIRTLLQILGHTKIPMAR